MGMERDTLVLNSYCVSGSVLSKPFLGYLAVSRVASWAWDQPVRTGHCAQKGPVLGA